MTEKLPLFRSVIAPAFVLTAALVLGACSGESVDVSVGQSTSDAEAPADETATSGDATGSDAVASDPVPAPTLELTDEQLAMVDTTGLVAEVVGDLGADPSNIPAAALDLTGADFCGFDVVDDASDGAREDPAARACFIAGVADNTATVMVQSRPSGGNQVVHVFRVDPQRGAVIDHNNSDGWSGRVCTDVIAQPEEGPNQFMLSECSSL